MGAMCTTAAPLRSPPGGWVGCVGGGGWVWWADGWGERAGAHPRVACRAVQAGQGGREAGQGGRAGRQAGQAGRAGRRAGQGRRAGARTAAAKHVAAVERTRGVVEKVAALRHSVGGGLAVRAQVEHLCSARGRGVRGGGRVCSLVFVCGVLTAPSHATPRPPPPSLPPSRPRLQRAGLGACVKYVALVVNADVCEG